MNKMDLFFTDDIFSALKRAVGSMFISVVVLTEKPHALQELTRGPRNLGGVPGVLFSSSC